MFCLFFVFFSAFLDFYTFAGLMYTHQDLFKSHMKFPQAGCNTMEPAHFSVLYNMTATVQQQNII